MVADPTRPAPSPGGDREEILPATPPTASYCGIDRHARTTYRVALDPAGSVRRHRNRPARPHAFRAAGAPSRPDLVVASACVRSRYGRADTRAAPQSAFTLGDAWGRNAVHGSETESDAHDADTGARL